MHNSSPSANKELSRELHTKTFEEAIAGLLNSNCCHTVASSSGMPGTARLIDKILTGHHRTQRGHDGVVRALHGFALGSVDLDG